MGKRALVARESAESAGTNDSEVTEVHSSDSSSSLSTDSGDGNGPGQVEGSDDGPNVESSEPIDAEDGNDEQPTEPEPMVEIEVNQGSKNGKQKKTAAAVSASQGVSAETQTAAGEDGSGTSTGTSGREIHHRIRQQAAAESWPDGPSDLASAFQWSVYNAKKLLASDGSCGAPDANTALSRLKQLMRLLEFNFEIHESYGGTGNGATTLHHQFEALTRECRAQAHHCALAAGLARLTG